MFTIFTIFIIITQKQISTYLRAGIDVAGYPCEPLVGAVHRDLGVAPDARALPRALGAGQAHHGQGRQQEQRRRSRHLRVSPSVRHGGSGDRDDEEGDRSDISIPVGRK